MTLVTSGFEVFEPKEPVTLSADELKSYDFTECAEQILRVLETLYDANLIDGVPYSSVQDVVETIEEMVEEVNFDDPLDQVFGAEYLRADFIHGMFSLEVFLGV